ncbi:MAG: peptidylprolyl isomerase [Candidatus Aquicultor secundus]|nr:MAG: peptidylprolyl isomerase [Candidatus Aquicultor secundus]
MNRIKFGLIVLFVAILAIGSIGCSRGGKAADAGGSADDVKQADVQPDSTNDSQPQGGAAGESEKSKWPYAVIETNKGTIVFQLFPHKALKNVANFIRLANANFYNGIKWHRVVPGYVIQGGDPLSRDNNQDNDGFGGPGYAVAAEINDVPHLRGTVSMVHNEKTTDGGSQFFICLSDQPKLDGRFTVIGKVTEGMDVVDKIRHYDVMNKVYIMSF